MTADAAPRRNRLRPFVWGALAAVLCLPAVAMQFTDEVKWGPAGFVLLGSLLAIVGAGYELTVRLSDNLAYRLGAGVGIVTGFLLIWICIAVGFIGDESPLDLMFLGLLVMLAAGALIVRFRARGLSVLLLLGAVVQAAAAAIGMLAGEDVPMPHAAVFVGLWLLSAGLFHRAARQGA